MQALYRWFWYLLPANPMVVRIVQGGSRRLRHQWVRLAYLGALVALVSLSLLNSRSAGTLTELAKAGTRVFAVVAYGQVILMCLIAPLFMAGAIAAEQSGKTFDILLTTPLSNLQIVLGSLLGRLFFVLVLLASGLPLFSVLLIFGGVPGESVFISFGVAALSALAMGSVAVTLAVLRAGGRKAVFIFVIAVAGYLVAAYALDRLVLRSFAVAGGATTWLTPLHPILVLEASLDSNYRPPPPEAVSGHIAPLRFYLARPFAAFATLTSLLSLVLLAASAVQLRRIGQGERWWGGRLRTWLRLEGPGQERRRAPRTVWTNPIAWREASTRGKLAAGILARWSFAALGLLLAVLLLWLYHYHRLPDLGLAAGGPADQAAIFRALLLTLLLVEIAVIALVAIYMSASSVSREREDGTLDLLLTTPITPQFYIWGKLRGLVSFLALLLAVPVLTLALVAAYSMIGGMYQWPGARVRYTLMVSGSPAPVHKDLLLPETPLLLALMLVPFVAFCAIVGVRWSLKSKGVLGAVTPTVFVVGLLALVLGLCGWNAAENIPLLGPMLNALSPATNIVMLLNPWERVSGFLEEPSPHVIGRLSLMLGALAAAGGYSLIVYGMLHTMVKDFDQTVRRLTGTT